jgi:hypothetical protein
MHEVANIDPGKLLDRREQIRKTVKHLRNERFALEQNAPWMDAVAYQRRLTILETLGAWYDEETAEINQALERLGRNCPAAFGEK